MAAGCSSGSSPSGVVQTGTWGGDHLTVTVSANGTHLEFDCAHGDIPGALTTGAGGAFNVTGTFVFEHGGPIVLGEPPDSHPASYAGTVSGTSMVLTVRVTDLNQTIGTFSVIYGSPGRVVKCLLPT